MEKRKLIVVESPSKIRMLDRILDGQGFEILATRGHVRSIPTKNNQVRVQGGKLQVSLEYLSHFPAFHKKLAAFGPNTVLFIATDPDREGERIAFDVEEVALEQGMEVHRIRYSAVTKEAVLRSLQEPKKVDYNEATASKARMVLDYYIGFTFSPKLWRVIKGATSVGRVQTPALGLLAEQTQKNLQKGTQRHCVFRLKMGSWSFSIKFSFVDAYGMLLQIRGFDFRSFRGIKRRVVCERVLPLNTLQAQRVMNVYHGWSAEVTMKTLQGLYENRMTKEDESLITYIRTDSQHLSREFFSSLWEFASGKGLRLVDESATGHLLSDGEESHEAIRPTRMERASVGEQGSPGGRLYEVIWGHAIGSILQPSTYVANFLQNKAGDVKSNVLYTNYCPGNDYFLPYKRRKVEESIEPLDWSKLETSVSFKNVTNWSKMKESELVSRLEEMNVGRPSTWSTIVPNLRKRKYLSTGKDLRVTHLGLLTAFFLRDCFSEITNGELTSSMEKQLDLISAGQQEYEPVLLGFIEHLARKLEAIPDRVRTEELLRRYFPSQECCGDPMEFLQGKGTFFYWQCNKCRSMMPVDAKWFASGQGGGDRVYCQYGELKKAASG